MREEISLNRFTIMLALFWLITGKAIGFYPEGDDPPASTAGLDTLAVWLAGSFSSEEQAAVDSDYRHITLRMSRICPDRTDGYWLYVEQAVAGYQNQPYRQRVYHIYQYDDTTFYSDVYLIPHPLRFTGAWRTVQPLNTLHSDSLTLKKGCTTFIHPADAGTFEGATRGRNCPSDLRGAAYATSQVIISRDRLVSWDRGYDTNDHQVWGAEKGGYIFRKLYLK